MLTAELIYTEPPVVSRFSSDLLRVEFTSGGIIIPRFITIHVATAIVVSLTRALAEEAPQNVLTIRGGHSSPL
jgi:hypothetical protein